MSAERMLTGLDGPMKQTELVDWMALDELRADEQKRAASMQKKGMRPRGMR